MEEIILFVFDLPVTICVAGGVVGEKAFVTTRPIGTPLILLPPFFFKIIFKCVGLVMFKKYCGFLHQNWFSLPFSSTRLPPQVVGPHLPWNYCSIVFGNWRSSIGSDENTLKKNGLYSSALFAELSVFGIII